MAYAQALGARGRVSGAATGRPVQGHAALDDFLLSKHPPRQAEELSTKGCGDETPAQTGAAAAASIAGIVQGGVIVPDAPLPEGMRVRIQPADSSLTWTEAGDTDRQSS